MIPLGILSYVASNLVCCCTSAACHCCTNKFKPKSSSATRAAYAVLFLFSSILAWTMETGWVDKMLASIPNFPYNCPTGDCYSGNFAVARVLMAQAIFHIVLGVIMIKVQSSKDFRAGLQNGWWGPKFLVWIGLVVATFFIPNKFFHTYSMFAFGGASVFIFIQLVLLIDFAAKWSESWVGSYEETQEKKWVVLLLGTAIIISIVIIAVTVLLYVFFCRSGCSLNIFFVTFNLILSIIVYLMSIHPKVQEARPSSGILQAAIVSLYSLYLIASALSGETEQNGHTCNPLSNSSVQNFSEAMGTIFTFAVIAYSTSTAALKSKVLMTETPKKDYSEKGEGALPLIAPTPSVTSQPPAQTLPEVPTNPAQVSAEVSAETSKTPEQREKELIEIGVVKAPESKKKHLEEAVATGALPKSALDEIQLESGRDEDDDEDEDDKNNHHAIDDEKNGVAYNYTFFHLIFGLAAMYVTMLINGWSTIDSETGELVIVGHNWTSVWVKVISSWFTFVLYGWTLVAPILFPDRDWS